MKNPFGSGVIYAVMMVAILATLTVTLTYMIYSDMGLAEAAASGGSAAAAAAAGGSAAAAAAGGSAAAAAAAGE